MKHKIYKEAEKLARENKTTHDLVLAIGQHLGKHFSSVKGKYITKDILESRFTPAEEAFDKGMVSCGSVVNISTAMLRHVGVMVELIHGRVPESRNHAWISVYEPEKREWVEYDLSRNQKGNFLSVKTI